MTKQVKSNKKAAEKLLKLNSDAREKEALATQAAAQVAEAKAALRGAIAYVFDVELNGDWSVSINEEKGTVTLNIEDVSQRPE